jgi:hypothetical protein
MIVADDSSGAGRVCSFEWHRTAWSRAQTTLLHDRQARDDSPAVPEERPAGQENIFSRVTKGGRLITGDIVLAVVVLLGVAL